MMELPPGFRFHPTDEELITHYLSPKVLSSTFSSPAIGEVDLNKCEPWDLPGKAKMGEKEWYFYCVRDRKYPTGLRTNRATEAGYWKATGKDKEILKGTSVVGMKKTLVFYTGRAPRGDKSNWVMHEYRLYSNSSSLYSQILPSNSFQKEWVICRILKKSESSVGKKGNEIMSDMVTTSSPSSSSLLPPLTESDAWHVTCFSDSMEEDQNDDALFCLPDFQEEEDKEREFWSLKVDSSTNNKPSYQYQLHPSPPPTSDYALDCLWNY